MYAFAQVFFVRLFVFFVLVVCLFVCLLEMMAQNFTPMNQDATRIKLIHLLPCVFPADICVKFA